MHILQEVKDDDGDNDQKNKKICVLAKTSKQCNKNECVRVMTNYFLCFLFRYNCTYTNVDWWQLTLRNYFFILISSYIFTFCKKMCAKGG